MPRLQGLIFDLDGTLIDSAPDIRQALSLMLAEHGRRAVTLEEAQRAVGDGAMVTVQRVFAWTGAPLTTDAYPLMKRFLTHYRNIRADPAQIYPGVVDLLRHYQQAGVKLGVCTNKQEEATYKLLEELALRPYFEFIAGGDTFPVHKPDAEHVLGVITGMDVDREGCVMIGDSINDVLAAHAAKIPCVVVTQGYGATVEKLGADKLVPDFAALPQALRELGYEA